MDIRPQRRISRRRFLQTSAQASLYGTWGCTPNASRRNKPPNVLLISLDATRADHLTSYGYSRQTSPALDALADNGTRFTNAISTSSWTLPAHASMFTGQFVSSHGARKYEKGNLTLEDAHGVESPRVNTIQADQALLTEVLQNAEYATGAVVASPWLTKMFGLHRGFDHYDDEGVPPLNSRRKRSGGEVTTRALQWLDGVGNQPFFLFLNYFAPHSPRLLPTDYERALPDSSDPEMEDYDEAIRYMDSAIASLLKGMKRDGLFDNTLIVAIGDHGELLRDHSQHGHGTSLYQAEIHVPLIVHYPVGESAPAVRDDFIQPVDLMPLILNRLDLPIPEGVQGSPVELISHPILAEVYPQEAELAAGHWQCLIDDGKKILFNSKGNHELYDLDIDPREEHDISAENPDLMHDMIAKLLTHFDALPRPEGAPPPLTIDASTMEELEAMGYL